MAEWSTMSRADLIRQWVATHEAELDALAYGSVSFVFSGRAPPRMKIERMSRLDDEEENGA